MKNIKLPIVLILFLQVFCCACFAQTNLNPCKESCQNLLEGKIIKTDNHPIDFVNFPSVIPRNPNEIVGLIGYDAVESAGTFRWVSATQTLAYTVYFENDADFATAAASKIPLAHCVRGGMVRFADGRVGKRRAASENVPVARDIIFAALLFPFLPSGAEHHSAKRDNVERNLLRLATNLQKV